MTILKTFILISFTADRLKNGDYGVIKKFNMVKERNGDRV